MCGIFGSYAITGSVCPNTILKLANLSTRRGSDSSGIYCIDKNGNQSCWRADTPISETLIEADITDKVICLGHTRLITNGNDDNQPVLLNETVVFHNGIIINHEDYFEANSLKRGLKIDTEALASLTDTHLLSDTSIKDLEKKIANELIGTVSCIIVNRRQKKLLLYTNNGSLYIGRKENCMYFASEQTFLDKIQCVDITNVTNLVEYDIVEILNEIKISDKKTKQDNLVPEIHQGNFAEEKLLKFDRPHLKRCNVCILPETMPFIEFNKAGVCNYCINYSKKQKVKTDLRNTIEKYIKDHSTGQNCIVPLSGGRDSTYALHLLVNEYKLKPITMTYDWGMVTDLARRNVSRITSKLRVENVIIADDLRKKRNYIKMNLQAWLDKPHLGMLNLLMAGDKHFFRHLQTLQKETSIKLNIWGMNPLEVTHFKAGFLGFPPEFGHKQVFYTGVQSQIKYQSLRLKQMFKNPRYFNSSIFDTLQGEYYRSIRSKLGFYNIFDYHYWDESEMSGILDYYNWESASDTSTNWRVGDGTAGFYNYVYYTVAGFSEIDTFRSNQVREGVITRDEALLFSNQENLPRYSNIRWYLDVLDMDFSSVINKINEIPKLYRNLDNS